MTIYDINQTKSHLEKMLFLDDSGGVGVQRFDSLKYPWIDEHNEHGIGLFWRPQDIDLTKDGNDFKTASPEAQHIFTSNLLRQIMLDSIHSRATTLVFGSIISEPAAESYLYTWGFFEAIHSRSYTHIIRNVYANPSEIFDKVNSIPEITSSATSIAKYYDKLGFWNDLRNLAEKAKDYDGLMLSGDTWIQAQAAIAAKRAYNEYEHKKALWRALNAANALEAIRFVVSFACAFAMEKNGLMEGNASIISMIFRDEREHAKFTSRIMNTLVLEDPDFAQIKIELAAEMYALFAEVVDQEKQWADYLFKEGSIIGLNAPMLKEYIDWLATIVLKEIGMIWAGNRPQSNPLPWMEDRAGHGKKQKALQEVDNDSYVIGAIDNADSDIRAYVGSNSTMRLTSIQVAVANEPTEVPVVQSSELVMYSKPNCPQCDQLKSKLTNAGITYTVKVLGTDFILHDLISLHSKHGVPPPRSFPVVWRGDSYVGGLADASSWIKP